MRYYTAERINCGHQLNGLMTYDWSVYQHHIECYNKNFHWELHPTTAVYASEVIPENTEYFIYNELDEETAFRMAGKTEEYSEMLFSDGIIVFTTPQRAAAIFGEQSFFAALAAGERKASETEN